MKIHRLVLPTLLGLALAITLLFAAVRQSQAALVIEAVTSTQDTQPAALSSHLDNPQATVRFVATSGADSGACTDSANPCRSVQYAIDQAVEGDEVRVASGTYTEVNNYGGLAQVVYLTKTVTIQGGYTLTNWIMPDPDTNPTVLDAQGLGQVVYITGTVSSTLSGMYITGGQPHGIQISNASVILASNQVYGNSTAGIRVDSFPAEISAVTLERNTLHDNPIGLEAYYSRLYLYDNAVLDNGAPGDGRGAYMMYSQVTLQGNLFTGNQGGGGIEIQSGTATLISNTFISNSADLAGGAISIAANEALLEDNAVIGNTSGGSGGGIYGGNSLTLRGNRIGSNTSAQYGGGIYLLYSDALLEENTLLNNSAGVMGGGLFSSNSSPQLLDNHLENNRSSWGGGAMLTGSPLISPLISGNIFLSNTAQCIGGGLLLDYSNGAIEGNIFRFNTGGQGGGMYLNNAPASLANNVFTANASDQGGGIYLYYSNAALNRNIFEQNNADDSGGGLFLLDSHAWIDQNQILSNLAGQYGGGIQLSNSSPTLTNNIIADNQSLEAGNGIFIHSPRRLYPPITLIHNTIARNNGGYGSGILVAENTDVVLSNTVIVSHSIGIDTGYSNNTAIIEGSLWGSGTWANGQDWTGEGIITGTVNIWGDPGFVDPDHGNYHIRHGSAAIDAGVDAGIYTDIDGELRPVGAGFDIGADELQANTRYVATTGTDSSACTDSDNPCRTVQYAVDQAAEGDEVRVAGGVYTGTHIRPRQDITTTGYVTQVVYISKTISVQGGYNSPDWTNPDPSANPTLLDAQDQGRVVYITGHISPTIEGFHIIQGNSTGLGGINFPYSQYDLDAGGGIYIHDAATTISNVHVISNTSPFCGGGIHLSYSKSTLQSNYITQNNSDWQGGGLSAFQGNNTLIRNELSINHGGGLYQDYGESVISENVFFNNIGGYGGGGLYLDHTTSVLIKNEIRANSAFDGSGGGIYMSDSVIELQNNIIHGNLLPNTNGGGGIYAQNSDLYMEGNTVSENYSFATGGILLSNTNADIVNNIIVDNDSLYNAAGIMVWAVDDISMTLRHNTFARNSGDFGAGVAVATGLVTLTNNIIVSQTIGVAYNGKVLLEGTLWGSGAWANGQDWDGNGSIITGTVNVWGDPGFVNPENGDYHIDHDSAALDVGIDAGVYTDIDGEPRPAGAGFDIGADEVQASLSLGLSASPGPVASGDNLTYTLILTNTGAVELHALITATLPAQVTPGGSLTWSADLPAGSDPWTEIIVVMVDPSYSGLLTSTLEAISLEGAQQVVTNTVTAIQPVSGLTALNSGPSAFGQPTTFTATVVMGSGVLFEWNFGDGSSANGAHVSHVYPSTGAYTATVTASNAVSSQTAQTIASVQEPVSGLSAISDSPTVLGQPTNFTTTVTAGSDLQFEWDFGDGTSGAGQNVEHTYPSSGVYTATITASNAVSDRSAQTIVIVEETIAGLSVAASSQTVLGQATVFTTTVSAGSNVSYTWDFGDGASGSGSHTYHTYIASGEYTVTVTASNLVSFASASTSVMITEPDYDLYLPIITKASWNTNQHFKDLPENSQLLQYNRPKTFPIEPTRF